MRSPQSAIEIVVNEQLVITVNHIHYYMGALVLQAL